MTDACPNCGKPVLDSDTVCWHCNYPLPKRPKPKTPPPRPGRGARVAGRAEAEAVDYDLRALAVYGLLTVALILSLWLVMRALGRQPILVRSADLARGDGWVTVTDNELRYTISLPSDWQWLDVAYRDQSELLPEVIARQPHVARAFQPLAATAGDADILGLAIDTQNLEDPAPVPFVVVGRSDRLGQLDPAAVLALLDEQPLPIIETEIDTRLARQPQARFVVLDAPHAYQCRGLFVAQDAAGYLVSACASQADSSVLQRELDDILDSFQLLEH